MKLFLILIVCFLPVAVFAQAVDPDWAENQHVAERIAYWRSIDLSGPDSNIADAKARGYNQFISMPRPRGMMIESATAWEQVGGSQQGTVSGRPTSIAFDPVSSQKFYLGTSGGGLWKTTDGGNTWTNLSDSWSTYAMGGVAVDQTNGNIIYAATGDNYDQRGNGIYKSTDGGNNWQHILSASNSKYNQVLIDPQVNTTIYVTNDDGVHQSLDAGVTWNHVVSIGGWTHMVIDPTNGQNLYASGGGVIKKSIDGGVTWNSGDLASNISGKTTITLGISKSNPSKIYASIGGGSGSVGLARSDDYGNTWQLVWNRDNYMSKQSFYDNACVVSPTNANYVLVGGLDIWGATNGGSTLNQYTNWTSGSSNSDFTHADIHVLAYGPNGLYALTDGGIFFSPNNGQSWQQSKNAHLSNMLFVGGDAAPDFSYVVGGAQDNGLNRATPGSGSSFTQSNFTQVVGGDGGRMFVSQTDGVTVYGTYINATLYKSAGQGISGNWSSNLIPGAYPDGLRLSDTEQAPFYMTYDVSESDPGVVAICGNSSVFYSNDGISTLNRISGGSNSPSNPQAVHIAPSDATIVYAGSGGGYVYVTHNAADGDYTAVKWKKSSTHIGVVADFYIDPNNPGNAWAAISGYGGKHFYMTTDTGKNWISPETDLPSASGLPDLSCSSITRGPNGDLFLGHTFGVLRSLDNGKTWEPLRDGMPLCQVTKLRLRGNNNEWLLATTYGRGMYRINVNDLPRTIQQQSVSAPAASADIPAITSISPNPIQANEHLAINFTIPKEGDASIILYDEMGRQAKTLLKQYCQQGGQSSEGDISGLPSGVYYAVLVADGHAVTQRIVIAK